MQAQRVTAVGVFEDRQHAQRAVEELRRVGFREDQIGIAGRDGGAATTSEATTTTGSNVGIGAAAGAGTGAAVGLLWGIAVVAGLLPAIGPAIAGGTLAALLSSAAGGAAAAGVIGALIGLGIPEEEAKYYEGEFHAGRTIVTVKADGRYDEAVAILRRHNGYDYSSAQSRTATSTTTATAATRTAAAPSSATGYATGAAAGARAGKVVQAKEEHFDVRKQPVETGEVQVRKEVHTEHKTVQVPVMKEEIVIERHAVPGHPAASSDIKAGEEIRVPVREEQVHVEKHPVVTEEVVVGKRQVQDTEQVSGTVRKEEIKVEKKGDVDVKEKRR